MIEFGNIYYFIALFISFGIIVGFYSILKNKTKDQIYKFLFILALCGFAAHFLKQIAYQILWHDFPAQLHSSTAENFCAVSVIIMPWMMLIKKKTIVHEFLYFISLLGGFLALIYPTGPFGFYIYQFEVIRFYLCHVILFSIPLYLCVFDIYRPSFKRWYFIPIGFMIYQTIICANTALTCFTGLSVKDGFSKLDLFLSREYQNNSFTFGPTLDMGFFGDFVDFLIPGFMKYTYNDRQCYWPVICLIIPCFVLFVPPYLLWCLPFKNKKNNKNFELKEEE